MSDPSNPPPRPIEPDRSLAGEALGSLLADVLEQADEIAGLDAARAEAWGSDVLACAVEQLGEVGPLIDALVAGLVDRDTGGTGDRGTGNAADPGRPDSPAAVALAAVGAVAPPDEAEAIPAVSLSGAALAGLGTARCEGAWLLRSGSALSAAFRFVDALDDRHVVTVDLVPAEGGTELVGEVVAGPGDLLDAIEESTAGENDGVVGISAEEMEPQVLAARVVKALAETERPRESAVAHARLVAARLSRLTGETVPVVVAAADDVPELAPRDREDDAYARSVLAGALGEDALTRAIGDPRVADVAELVAPTSLVPFPADLRDAVVTLEWADWLGAVLGLARADRRATNAAVDGQSMVEHVNRCQEVTSTIPKGDRARIAWAFDRVIAEWVDLALVDIALVDIALVDVDVVDRDGRRGVLAAGASDVLVAALGVAWSSSAT